MNNGKSELSSGRDNPDRGAGGRSEASDSIRRAAQAYKAGNQALAVGWLCAAIEEIVSEPPTVQTLKARSRREQIREGQRSRKALHGEDSEDEEVIAR